MCKDMVRTTFKYRIPVLEALNRMQVSLTNDGPVTIVLDTQA